MLLETLIERNLTLATAESCTGGMLAARITATPGISAIYGYGLITYSNEAKMRLLNVPPRILAEHGAVSRETAAAMASGLQELAQSSLTLAITGIAGPGGGSLGKPVGLVYIALAHATGILVHQYHFGGDRQQIREQTCDAALAMLAEALHIKPN